MSKLELMAEIMDEVSKLEQAESPMARGVARGLVALRVGAALGLSPEQSFAAVRPTALRLVKVNEVPWGETL